MLIIVLEPGVERPHPGDGAGLLLRSEGFLFECGHAALGICMALRVVVAGKRLVNSQRAAGLHEGQPGSIPWVKAYG
jgi:hypothetical protein